MMLDIGALRRSLDRRDLIRLAGASTVALCLPAGRASRAAESRHAATDEALPSAEAADHTIRIGIGNIELAPGTTISTKLYNGQFPGPLLRMTEGKRAIVDIYNDTETPEQLHWHGQFLAPDVDGASEEGTPFIPPHGKRRIALTPGPAGFRFYHTHVTAGSDLSLGLYNGEIGPLYIEPRREPGSYDREVFLVLKEFEPWLTLMDMDDALDFLEPKPRNWDLIAASPQLAAQGKSLQQGYDIDYKFFAVNGRMLGHGEPIRVKQGERVLFHVLNASASAIRSLAMPGHDFEVVALDGNPVPRPSNALVLWIAPAERVSAIVEMREPGVWILGDITDGDRQRGMGIVVEYADRTGTPKWQPPDYKRSQWDYRWFTESNRTSLQPDEVLDITISVQVAARDGFDVFTINGVPFSMESMEPLFRLTLGRRYQLHLLNGTTDIHPIHLHRHSFEITSVAGKKTAGIVKDVAMLGGFQEMTIDFTADQPGLSLFHCHMQPHMDYGFMALFDCA